eukprot:TRINITY_DN78959_c0_g1_i1.p1 TRINITY_DN78959_c0_g1~~TRINITY_DN78959_c0_g1_i1.p1  ORF type:complete len:120 (-),score=12.85 TRINITY_DN78959_c0_g1_i1:98-457(-)
MLVAVLLVCFFSLFIFNTGCYTLSIVERKNIFPLAEEDYFVIGARRVNDTNVISKKCINGRERGGRMGLMFFRMNIDLFLRRLWGAHESVGPETNADKDLLDTSSRGWVDDPVEDHAVS